MQQLTLDDEVKTALLTQDNFMGQLINDTIGYERFDGSVFDRMSDEQKFAFIHSYQKSLIWPDEVLRNFLVSATTFICYPAKCLIALLISKIKVAA